MAFTVQDALQLNALNKFVLVAGRKGLSRSVLYPSILDHEDSSIIKETVLPGEFVISNLLVMKDSPEMVFDFVQSLIYAKAACFALKTIYLSNFPADVISLAEKNDFPLFLFNDIYVEDIIIDIDRALHANNYEKLLQATIKKIIDSNTDELKRRELASEINRCFIGKHVVYYVKSRENVDDATDRTNHKYNLLFPLLPDASRVVKYDSGLLLILSLEQGDAVVNTVESALTRAGITEKEFYVGISDTRDEIEDLDRTILESIFAYRFAQFEDTPRIRYTDMGIYCLLVPLVSDTWAHFFYKETTDRLIEYDKVFHSDLLKTAIEYVKTGGNISQTADSLFQHMNTVRYRLRKIYQVIGIDKDSTMGYDTLSIAIRLYLLDKTFFHN